MAAAEHPVPLAEADGDEERWPPDAGELSMSPRAALVALARLATVPSSAVTLADALHACAILREALAAEDAYIVRAGDPYFIRLGSDADPKDYEIKQKGYYLIWRELASHPRLMGGGVQVRDRLVEQSLPLRPGMRPTHLACILPGHESNSEMLIVRGPWPRGLTAAQVRFFTVARPLVAALVGNLLDAERQARQRQQLGLLAEVAGAFSQSDEGQSTDRTLTAIATALANASGFDWVTLVLFDDALERVTALARNLARFSHTTVASRFWDWDGAHAVLLADARYVQGAGKPLLIPDVFQAEAEQSSHEARRRYAEVLRRNYERAHILSTAVFPIWFQGRFVGTAVFSSAQCRLFDQDEVAFLTALVAQAAAGIGGLRLYEELRRANARLAHLATHDALTNLVNRSVLRERLQAALSRPVKTDQGDAIIALLFVDLDGFKVVNDTLGHQAGDELLVQVAARLTAAVRPSDTVARFGGDEFAVLLDGLVPRAGARRTAERILFTLRSPFTVTGRQVLVGASIGIACGLPGQSSPDELLRQADTALYRAKGAGKGQVVVFEPNMHAGLGDRLELAADLHGALERGEFALYYQPEVDLSSGRTVCVEALLRWRHPRRGVLLPGAFLSLAEESGLIVPLGQWVLEEACCQAARWGRACRMGRRPMVSVNLAVRQLTQADLPAQVEAALRAAGLPAAALCLEVTEGALLAGGERATANLVACRALGVAVALDDFGTGYSALGDLLQLPVKVLKIDRSLVQRLESDAGAAVVRAVCASARALGIAVTAEGIESAEQAARARALGCRRGQGFYFSEPVPAELLATRLFTVAGARRRRLHLVTGSPPVSRLPTLPSDLPRANSG